MKNKLWVVPLVFLVGTYFLTSGSQLYKLVNVVDTYIYFIYAQIVFNALLIGLVFFVLAKVSALTALPGFITDSFVANFVAEGVKEKGIEALDKIDKAQLLKEKFDRFSMPSLFLKLTVSIGALVAAYTLVGRGGSDVSLNGELVALLGVNFAFIGYFFYGQVKPKSLESAAAAV